MPTSLPMTTVSAAAASAAVAVAAGFGVTSAEPLILSDGANVIVHLSPSPVVRRAGDCRVTPAELQIAGRAGDLAGGWPAAAPGRKTA